VDIQQVIAYFRSPACTARALDTSPQNISGWIAEGAIPRCRQYEIQVKTNGALIAESWDPERDYRGIRP
jgi:DNA-binding transcriptional regulator Cro